MLLFGSLFVVVDMQKVLTAVVDLEEVRAYRNDFRSRCMQVPFT